MTRSNSLRPEPTNPDSTNRFLLHHGEKAVSSYDGIDNANHVVMCWHITSSNQFTLPIGEPYQCSVCNRLFQPSVYVAPLLNWSIRKVYSP